MISIVCFKWNKRRSGYQLPSSIDGYTPDHVNILYRSVQRNTTLDHRFICVTDDRRGLDPSIEVVPLWNYYRYLGGCFNRLYMFSSDMRDILGPRFITIDLDSVVVSNIDHLLSRDDDFIINEYDIQGNNHATHQYYNGSIIMMNAGARESVWTQFDPRKTPPALRKLERVNRVVGTDQAWIAHHLGPGESTFNPFNGVIDFRKLDNKNKLPINASIVLFPGKRDPSSEWHKYAWIRKHWRL